MLRGQMTTTVAVNFGLIGAGRIARNQIAPAIHASKGAMLYGAASRDVSRAESMRPTRVYDSYAALIGDADVEAVYVATHNGLHKELSIAALRAGKHVLCEKPLATNARDCEEMLRVAESSGKHLVEASFRFPLINEDDVRMNPEWGGGSLLDVGCYCVSASRMFLGDLPVGMKAIATYHPAKKVETCLQGVLDYGSGRYAIIACGFDGGVHEKVVLCGTSGTIELNRPFKSWTGRPAITVRTKDREEVIDFEAVNTFALEVDDLATAILWGNAPSVGAGDALLNMRILDRLAEAARQS